MEIVLRRWTGDTIGGRERRLIVKGADGVRLGHIDLDSNYLFMWNGRESLRAPLREALAHAGVYVEGPPLEVLETLGYLDDVYLARGTRDRIKMLSTDDGSNDGRQIAPLDFHFYDLATGERLPPIYAGEYHAAYDTLSVSYQPSWSSAVDYLRRLGAVPLDHEPRPLTDELVHEINGWSPPEHETVVEVDDDGYELVDDEDYDQPAPVFFGRPLPLWEPGYLTAAELYALRAEHVSLQDTSRVDSGRRLLPAARALLPRRLHPIIEYVLSQQQQQQHAVTPEHLRDPYDDPRGFYRPWTKKVDRWDTPEWHDDARGMTGRLPDAVFTSDVETWIAAAKSDYGGSWAAVAAWRAAQEQPSLWAAAVSALDSARRDDPDMSFTLLPMRFNEPVATIEYLASRLWRRGRKSGRDWPVLPVMDCAICGDEFDPSVLDPTDHLAPLGPPRWCPACCYGSWGALGAYAYVDAPFSKDDAITAVAHLADTLGFVPPQTWYRMPIAATLPTVERDRILLARSVAPRSTALKALAPRWSWTDWLRAAGVIGETLRTSRGTLCIARDGHPCRSMLELVIDDYLDAAGIEHDLEPLWPWHAQLNASGARRADWRLEDGTFVEAAGLVGDPAYDAKMAEKVALAEEVGIRLIVLTPDDLPRLAERLPPVRWS